MKHFFTLLTILMCIDLPAQDMILDCGHSHNDYIHRHPLSDALSYGYKSIEIDVWLHGGRLVVDHDGFGLDHKKDIEELYLRPIQERIQAHGGRVYDGDTAPTIFMVEFKNDGEACYVKLKELIEKYKGLFCDRMGRGGPIKILITGNKPWKTLLKGNELYATGDGGISQSSDKAPAYIIERVSDPYQNHFSWRGRGEMPKAQKEKLMELVKLAHDHGRQIRFYGLPQNENVWRELLDAGVDWINVDKLEMFARFYKGYVATHGKSTNCHCVRM
jgi:glycerophosphoryl diester phosphodiesterase